MKKKSTFFSLILFVSLSIYTVINTSYSGFGAGQFNNYSGTPCTSCHGNGAPNTQITINGLPATYSHGQSYPLSVTITDASKVIAGFQIQTNIGVISTTDPTINVYAGNRSAGHNAPKGMISGVATFNFTWTAPSAGGTPANFGTQGIAANGNGNTSGDGGRFLTISNIALPVRFTNVLAAVKENSIALQFETSEEKNIKEFQIQRRTYNSDFITLTSIAPKGNGFYSYGDAAVEKGIIYQYRIKEISNDNEHVYSKVVSAQLKSDNDLIIYPTIVKNGILYIQGITAEKNIDFSLFSLNGKLLQHLPNVSNKVRISTSASGIYLALLSNNGLPIRIQKLQVQ